MPGFGDMFQKAFYLGVGLATYAGEKAGGKLTELRAQAEKLAAEMVERGEMSTEEARRFVEEAMTQGQRTPVEPPTEETIKEPRSIEILEDDEEEPSQEEPKNNEPKNNKPKNNNVDTLRQQVQDLQEELRRLQKD
ncbi:MAG: hypothetical protein F6J93_02685 [Oscillatoria sp. SIO1A7]|nr:hypothetical protein [Oscillatoria sp. SIO1A7]